MDFFEKRTWVSFRNPQSRPICYRKMILFLQSVFSTLVVKFFAKKRQKNFKIRKITKIHEEKVFFVEQIRFHRFSRPIQQNWRTHNMPVVPGGLVIFRQIYRIWTENVPLKWNVFHTMFNNCVHDVRSCFWKWTLFSPSCNTFAVECDWSSWISEKNKIWVFWEKYMGIFRKRPWTFQNQ